MPTDLEAKITARVIDARKKAELDRRDLADALVLDLNSYGHYERGRYAFTIDQLFILSRVLNRSVPWLLGLDTGLTEAEDELLTCFRNTDDSGQNAVLSVARSMARDRPRT